MRNETLTLAANPYLNALCVTLVHKFLLADVLEHMYTSDLLPPLVLAKYVLTLDDVKSVFVLTNQMSEEVCFRLLGVTVMNVNGPNLLKIK